MKSQQLKSWVVDACQVLACASLVSIVSACRSPEPAKAPMVFIGEDGALVLPAGNVLTLESGRVITTRVDYLMFNQATVSNLQAQGYLP